MTWSGFRPSDDACAGGGYLVPSNMFAVVILGYLEEIFSSVLEDTAIVEKAKTLREEIQEGIEAHGRTQNAADEDIYAYEVDGLGNASIMDDSNVPNLISAPYLGYGSMKDERYLRTRKTLLSKENPYFYEGKYAKGIGSSHTPENYIWPIAMAMEGMTTDDKAEKERILNQLVATDAGTNLMHEGFDVDDPTQYTREWFSWANMMFCELVMDYFDIQVEK
jgi:meiotically up-regulated gene 157 (Mug157) protein